MYERHYYDVAQICENGHLISQHIKLHPEAKQSACSECGKPTYDKCRNCNEPIRGCKQVQKEEFVSGNMLTGERNTRNVIYCNRERYKIPLYCHKCGQPFPWTEAKFKAAKALIEEDDQLDDSEKESLNLALPDLIVDSPNTPLAVSRFRRFTKKALTYTGDGLRDIFIDICSESIKKLLWPNP